MSLFGKVLTILNAVFAVAFLVIAAMDYQARNQWAYSAFRHDLAIHGLPIDDKDDSWRPGRALVKDINANTLKDLFQRAGGDPVSTQIRAVEQAKKTAVQFIESQPDEAKKRVAIGITLLPLIPHSHERLATADSIKKKPIADLMAKVENVFDLVDADLKGNSSIEFKRMRAADLLYNLYHGELNMPDRALAVLGLEAYVQAADRQATNLYGQVTLLEQRAKEESAIFARQMQELQPKLVLMNDELKADKVRLDQQKKVLEQQNLLLTARQAERDELQRQLDKAIASANTETAQLAAVQEQLFAVQREIAAARERNEKLEGQIRSKELGK